MPWSISHRVVQNAIQFFSPPRLEKPKYYWKTEGLCHWSIRVSLLETDSPRLLDKKLAMSPPSAGHKSQYDAKYSLFD